MTNQTPTPTLPTPPKARTKRHTAPTIVARETLPDAPYAPEIDSTDQERIDWQTLDTTGLDLVELERIAAIATFQTAAYEARMTERLRALDVERAALIEKSANIRQAGQLLNAKSRQQRQAAVASAIAAERATKETAYAADMATRQTLFMEIQRLTLEIAAAVKDALAVDARIYAAALTLGIATQRSGYAKRAMTDYLGRQLSQIGLTDMPRGRLDRNLVDPQPAGNSGR